MLSLVSEKNPGEGSLRGESCLVLKTHTHFLFRFHFPGLAAEQGRHLLVVFNHCPHPKLEI